MPKPSEADVPKSANRREILRRLAGAVVAAYVVPEVLMLSEARAEGSAPTPPSDPTAPSEPSPPSSPSSSTGPSTGEDSYDGAGEDARERCQIPDSAGGNSISISRSDLNRSQEAIAAGYAKPLDQIWGTFISSYNGKVIGVEFIGRLSDPRYRFRAISRSGRLETVTISAQTGVIEQIVGCG